MADLSITAASVLKSTGAKTRSVIAGETLTAGQPVYKASNNKWYRTDANASLAAAQAKGVTLHAALADQPVLIQTSGKITIGATVALGTIYVVSATAGGIAPSTDLLSGWYTWVLGIPTSTTVLDLILKGGDQAVP